MAFGSATIPPKKHNTQAQAREPYRGSLPRSNGNTDAIPAAAQSTSIDRVERQARQTSAPGSSSNQSGDSENDSDFGRGALEAIKKETQALREKEEALRLKQARANAKKLGLPMPPALKKSTGKREMSSIGAVRLYEDDRRRLNAARHSAGKRRRDSDIDTSGDDELVPTEPTFNSDYKRAEIYRRSGLKVASIDRKGKGRAPPHTETSEGSDDEGSVDGKRKLPRSMNPKDATLEEIEAHLQRRWADKAHPERMTKYRKRMEEEYNPLIKLLSRSSNHEQMSEEAN